MTTLLFVDDDGSILKGLRDTLRVKRREWDMHFIDSGQGALDFLSQNTVDIIVSDMRMPQMDGAVLLEHVRTLYPHMTRLVLSGHSERDQLLRASAVAHQYLSKPCPGDLLRDTLSKIAQARERSPEISVREMVGRLVSLPSVGAMHQELMQSTSGGSNHKEALTILLNGDSGLALRVCDLARTAYPDREATFSNSSQIIASIGFERSRAIALIATIAMDLERNSRSDNFKHDDWVMHSLRCARITEELVEGEKRKEMAFASGMLHDIGRAVHSLNEPVAYDAILAKNAKNGADICELETEEFGTNHGQTGCFLLETWGLDSVIAQASLNHHTVSDPNSGQGDFCPDSLATFRAVQEANRMNKNPTDNVMIDAKISAKLVRELSDSWG